MLEALVDLRHDRESDLKRRGDILAVKPAGSVWSDAEQRFHKVFRWEDPQLEATLTAAKKRGERNPTMALPYATWDRERLEMTSRSTQFVDVDSMTGDLKRNLLDRETKLNVVDLDARYRKDRVGRIEAPRIFRADPRPRILTGNQFRALAATVSTIRPAGGGDYTTLAAWEAFADGQASGDQWAECYTGGDLGFVDMSGWTGTINASTYPRIYGAAGNRHNGDITAGAYISDVSGYIAININYVEVDGIRCSGRADRIITVGVTNPTIKNCLIENTSTSPQCVLFAYSTGCLAFNNICIGGSSGIQLNATSSGAASGEFYNNTLYGCNTAGLRFSQATNACTGTAKNNIAMNCTADFLLGGSPSVTSDYNLISDGTLTTEGIKGANDIESATLAAVLTDAANDDFTLVSGSAARNSALDLTGTIDATDAAGISRPQGAGWDRGALEAELTPVDLSPSDCSHGHTAGECIVSEVHSVTIQAATHSHVADECIASEVHPVAVENVTHPHTVDASAITAKQPVGGQDASHTHTADAAALSSTDSVTPDDATHGHTADASALASTDSVTVQDASHGHTAGTSTVSEVHTVTGSDASHNHTADTASVSEVHTIAVEDASHAHTADNSLVSAVITVGPASATHGHTADAAAVSAVDMVTVADATHAHTAAEPVILTPLLTIQIDAASYYVPGLERGADYTPGLEAGSSDVPGLAKGHYTQG